MATQFTLKEIRTTFNPPAIKRDVIFSGSNFINTAYPLQCDNSRKPLVFLEYVHFKHPPISSNDPLIDFRKTKHLDQITFDDLCFTYKDYVVNNVLSGNSWLTFTYLSESWFSTNINTKYLTNQNLPNHDLVNNYVNYLKLLQVIPVLNSDSDTATNCNFRVEYVPSITICKSPTNIPKLWRGVIPKNINTKYYVSVYQHSNTYFLQQTYKFNISEISSEVIDKFILYDFKMDDLYYILRPDISLEVSEGAGTVSIQVSYNLNRIIADGNWSFSYYSCITY